MARDRRRAWRSDRGLALQSVPSIAPRRQACAVDSVCLVQADSFGGGYDGRLGRRPYPGQSRTVSKNKEKNFEKETAPLMTNGAVSGTIKSQGEAPNPHMGVTLCDCILGARRTALFLAYGGQFSGDFSGIFFLLLVSSHASRFFWHGRDWYNPLLAYRARGETALARAGTVNCE